VFWLGGDFRALFFQAWRASEQRRVPAIEQVMPAFHEHPGVRSYIDRPGDLAPRRVSELPQTRERDYAEALNISQDLLGHDQLSILHAVSADEAWSGHGWIIGRDHTDFDDPDVEVAAQLAPVLVVLDRLHRMTLADQVGEERWQLLTPREQQIVTMLGTGMTARAVGAWAGIAESTVNAHLEHAYRKLGVHDRVSAILAAPRRP
jgi:DNA-binding CsgD family transcriptional regulator